jgi:hypothetical protein
MQLIRTVPQSVLNAVRKSVLALVGVVTASLLTACETPEAMARPATPIPVASGPDSSVPPVADLPAADVAPAKPAEALPVPALPEPPAQEQSATTPRQEQTSAPAQADQAGAPEPNRGDAAAQDQSGAAAPEPTQSGASAPGGAEIFTEMAKVLQHPRCMNCHVSGKSPKQGDDGRVHMPPVERGADGRGSALTCKTCHTDKNGPVAPGAPDWHLAPVAMAWEGLSVAELCRALTDKSKNGGRDAAALAKHLTEDPLVQWGWNPGGTRKPVPIAKEPFAKLVSDWASAGGACPQ